jgi:hypothetical protein
MMFKINKRIGSFIFKKGVIGVIVHDLLRPVRALEATTVPSASIV